MQIQCPNCKAILAIEQKHIEKNCRCKKCNEVFFVEQMRIIEEADMIEQQPVREQQKTVEIQCPKCGKPVREDALVCHWCKSAITTPTSEIYLRTNKDIHEYAHSAKKTSAFDILGLLTFEYMISNLLIKIIYYIGLFLITLWGCVLIFRKTIIETPQYGDFSHYTIQSQDENIVLGLIVLIIGNILWRIICECWIVIFRIHEALVSINRKM